MISICIPVYNTNITSLVSDLSKQIQAENFEAEIRIYDDHSTKYQKENRTIITLPNVIYKEMPKNLGRSAIRNLLAADSKGNSILFIDGDMQVVSDDFVKKYYSYHNTEQVVCGGITMSSKLPDPALTLRWNYGIKRETTPAEKRELNPYSSLMTGNIMFPKSLLIENPFDENIAGYGHEDTKMGFQLSKLKYPIVHIDNALLHSGLENSSDFLSKTEIGIKNLILLWHRMECDLDFAKFVRLLKNLKKYNNFIFRFLVTIFFSIFGNKIQKNLTGPNPNLFYFDLYKFYFAVKTNKSLNKSNI